MWMHTLHVVIENQQLNAIEYHFVLDTLFVLAETFPGLYLCLSFVLICV